MVPLLVGCMFAIQRKAHRLWQIHRKKNSNLNAFIHENFSGIRIVQSFAAERIFDILDTPSEIADRIFYVDGKKILEIGTHEELMAKKGAYYRLCQSQFCV